MTTNSLVNLAVFCISCSPILKVFNPVAGAFPIFEGLPGMNSGVVGVECDIVGESEDGGGGRRGISAGTGTGGGGGEGSARGRR